MNFFCKILLKIQREETMMVMRYTKSILLNSKTSLVLGQRRRGVKKKRERKEKRRSWLILSVLDMEIV